MRVARAVGGVGVMWHRNDLYWMVYASIRNPVAATGSSDIWRK
ncbi:hypothetical protein GJA_2586 [Janthinobacterium agaricidamnosum NBRC 102515 = DSM 9628]|uniref:Uncharacterized protein n=1 Tax=Janthinobacterium agaricidamnosum NBRC 102515 = DSM 9628 TaxID=1349767 RepID=W0V7H2_9BURK|nr:hypothetical protein GJA_2586 [Janthinobacterium agaricidamnosum NBRC 102515 = DSM 9628]